MFEVRIEIFKSLWGESFLVTCNIKKKPIHILIDMGFDVTYESYIKDRLIKISKDGKLDILIFTHIDSDHISGGLKFLTENGKKGKHKIIEIGDIWYNAYRHLQFSKRTEYKLPEVERKKLKDTIISGIYSPDTGSYKEASGEEGSILGGLILNGGYNWNNKFLNNAIQTDATQIEDKMEHIKFKILSPDLEELEKLEGNWRDQLKKLGILKVNTDTIFDDAFEVLMSKEYESFFIEPSTHISAKEDDLKDFLNISKYKDRSPINGSSISFVLEFKNKKILFLADSHHTTIIKNLKNIYGLVCGGEKMFFDVIKVSHHGSHGNSSIDLFDLIDSNKFIISTNGDIYDHPSFQTIAQIVCRPTEIERTLYFNYEHILDKFNNPIWMEKYKYNLNCIDKDIVEILLFEEDAYDK